MYPVNCGVELWRNRGVSEVSDHQKYLGLPSTIGRSKKEIFASILERVRAKIEGGQATTLSRAGKEVLIKVVLQAIPCYAMQCFKLPTTLCQELERIMANFWWGSTKEKRKPHWVAWRSKMGAWTFKAKYYPDCSFWDASLGSNPSFTWLDIAEARDYLRPGCIWTVDNGVDIWVWKDTWVHKDKVRKLVTPPPLGFENARVSILLDLERNCWDEDLINDLFLPCEAQLILDMPFPNTNLCDQVVWKHGSGRGFEVKSAYQ
ncbi:hypothetical protein LIER_43626 [Lithospermum erythrorhizon]|uniref:Reverse transcriptase n=1 Tax=Lithospermum erythrorhizon TaxID=34254 RepID=A0AAV3QJ20_LITER